MLKVNGQTFVDVCLESNDDVFAWSHHILDSPMAVDQTGPAELKQSQSEYRVLVEAEIKYGSISGFLFFLVSY